MSESLLEFDRWPAGITQASIPVNNNARRAEALTGPAISATTAAQPASPAELDIYILPAAATGAQWATFDEGDVVIYYNATWTAYAPFEGLRKFVEDEGEDWQFVGDSSGGWAAAGGGGGVYTGTAGSITLTGSAFSIDATYVGQTSITTLGTVATGTWNATNISLAKGGTGTALTDPNADRIMFWDDSAGAVTWLTLGTNLSITGATIDASGGGGGSPGGSTTQIQWNNAGAFAGMTATYNSTTETIITKAPVTAGAGLRLPHGSAPTTGLANGDVWTTTAGLYVRVNGATVGPMIASASITGWTASTNTSSPNNTVNAARFLVASASTNADAVIQPKGTGAIQGQLADSASAGGNKRGSNAVDWQTQRNNATEVASAANSTISGGLANTASGNASTVGGGQVNVATGAESTIGGGDSNVAAAAASCVGGGISNNVSIAYGTVGGGNGNIVSTGQSGTVAGGEANTSSALRATVGGGFQNIADGQYSWIPGGYAGNVRGIYGASARASGQFAANGDAQTQVFVLRASTTDATQTTLTTDASAAGINNQVVLPDNSCYIVKGTMTGRQNTTGDASGWEFTAMIKRGANAAATAMVVACTPVVIGQSAGATTWALAVDADTTNGSLRIRVTGQAAKTIRWACDVHSCVQVAG